MPTVLIVEDERKLRDLLRGYLEREGITVLTAGTGADGLSLASAAKPDLVVLDLHLPDIPGESVMREIRRASQVPVLMLTAKSDEEDRALGLPARPTPPHGCPRGRTQGDGWRLARP